MVDTSDTWTDRALGTIRANGMLKADETVLVAVSGGPDSICLLDILVRLGYQVHVAHFDHQTRDGASAEDAAFVRDLASRMGLPFHFGTRPVLQEATERGLSFEQYARHVRYAFLVEAAKESGCQAIATGHHADDQAETILMRTIRGTSPRGLAGTAPVSERDGTRIIRPLAELTREAILAYVEHRGLAYRVDHTNQDTAHFRNRVRHELLPLLTRDYNPRIRDALLRLGEVQRAENSLLNELSERALADCLADGDTIDRARFRRLDRALQRRAIVLWALRHGVECPFERVDGAVRFLADGPTGKWLDMGDDCSLCNDREHTRWMAPADGAASPDISEKDLAIPGETQAFGRVFRIEFREPLPPGKLPTYCTPGLQVFDADTLGLDLAVRHRRPGDRFTPFGMSPGTHPRGAKKLKDYFIEHNVPAATRDQEVLVVAHSPTVSPGDERIAWIVGRAIDARVAVTSATRHMLQIEVLNETQR